MFDVPVYTESRTEHHGHSDYHETRHAGEERKRPETGFGA
jgi:hypothetical protein